MRVADRGNFKEAENSLRWLRGWTTSENVRPEFEILKEANSRRDSRNRGASSSSNRFRNMIEPYLQRSFCLPLVSVCFIFIIRAFMGTETLQVFAEVIFYESNIPYVNYMTVALYAVDILGTIAYIFFVNLLGKKKLLFISLVGSALSYSIIATSKILISKRYWEADGYNWIPAITILLSVFITTSGVDTIVIILTAELFPSKFRDVGAGIGLFVCSVSLATLNYSFMYLKELITMPGVFIFFAVNSVIGLVTFYFIVPETEGRSLAEIEEHYAGIKKLENRSSTKKKATDEKYVSSKLG